MLFLLILSLVNGFLLEFTMKHFGKIFWWVFVEVVAKVVIKFGQLIILGSHKNYSVI